MAAGSRRLKARIHLYQGLAALLEAGLLPGRALAEAARHPPHPISREALQASAAAVERGAGLAASLDPGKACPIPPAERAALQAGEAAGRQAETFRLLASRLEVKEGAGVLLARGLAYPLLVLHLAVLVASLPGLTEGPGPFLVRWLGLTALMDGLLAGGVLALLRGLSRTSHPNRWPLVGRPASLGAQRDYLASFSFLHGSGVDLLETHRLASGAVALEGPRGRLGEAAPGLETGESLTTVLARSGVFEPEVLASLTTAEGTGDLEETSARMALLLARRERESLERLARLAGGAAYVVAVGATAWVVLSFYAGLLGRLGNL